MISICLLSECPPLPTSVMDGGRIELKTLRVPFDRTHFHYDCAWQLKVPEGISGLRVFVRITSMDLTEGKALMIIPELFVFVVSAHGT